MAKRRSIIPSIGIILVALGLTYVPLPGMTQTVVVVAGTELKEPLEALEPKFERENPNIKLELKFQGSQDMVNKYVDNKNDFKPTVLIPATGGIFQELSDRWKAQNSTDPFYDQPKPIAKTILVAIAWPERGKTLFPDGRFQWQRIEQAMQGRSWSAIGGPSTWGSFDFVTTDPTRSNSGQLTLSLWTQAKLNRNPLMATDLNDPIVPTLFSLVKRSVYQPPRSTDILLQEFIAKGPNDADVATVYESIALNRWQQAGSSQGKPYQIYYLNPTIETVSTAAIVRRDVDDNNAKAARKFLDFLTQTPQQSAFVQYGFRPVITGIDLKTVPNSPWSQNIPGAETDLTVQLVPSPDRPVLTEVIRQWDRAQ